MCAVPPGPSPPPPFHRQTKRTLSTPHASAVYSSHRLQRSYALAPFGSGPSSAGKIRGASFSCAFTVK
jgi:hypothetical protein